MRRRLIISFFVGLWKVKGWRICVIYVLRFGIVVKFYELNVGEGRENDIFIIGKCFFYLRILF